MKNEKRGPKPGRDNKRTVLTNDQRRTICETILEKNPAELNLEFSLWTTKLILSLIKNKFQIDINQRTLCSYLNVWGFTVQRPEKPAIQIKWLENQYPDVKRKAKTEKALIYWVDAAEIQQGNRLNQYSSTVKEEPIPLFHNEDATKAPTMISAVNNQGKIYFKIEKRALDAENCLGFLEALLHDNAGRKIFVITGIPLIQQAKAISQWVETHKEKIELYLLPINPPVES